MSPFRVQPVAATTQKPHADVAPREVPMADQPYEKMLGELIVSHGAQVEGVLTHYYRDGGIVVGIIDDSYEVNLTGAVICYDVRGAWRKISRLLPSVFIRRASAATLH